MPRISRGKGRERRLRERLFDAGNNRCPICLSVFNRSDVSNGTSVTLEHAPPKSLGGNPICLTCKACNNKTSKADHHAFLSAKARDEWAGGQGSPIDVNFLGHKRKYRFIPKNSNAPFPAQKHLFQSGIIKLDALPSKLDLCAYEGISFKIPHRDDFEFVSMIKSAYLMVFALMGTHGYQFAENVGVRLIREQIMNPEEKILKGGFVGEMKVDSEDFRKIDRTIVFLLNTSPYPIWIVPMSHGRIVVLPSGNAEPINELVMSPKRVDVSLGNLTGWISRKFSDSSAIGGPIREWGSDLQKTSLVGTFAGPIPTSREHWRFIVVFCQAQRYVALPFSPMDCLDEDCSDDLDFINVVDMFGEPEVRGRKLDRSQLTTTGFSHAREITMVRKTGNDEQGFKED